MAGPFDHLHIKGRTAGSSNELSFDVLDAARSELEPQKRSSLLPSTPKVAQGSFHGVSGTSTFAAAPEVTRRKKARRAHTVRIWLIGLLAVAALVGAGAYFGYGYYRTTMDFKGQYNALIERLVDIDKTMVEIDTFMEDPAAVISAAAPSEQESDVLGETKRYSAVEELFGQSESISRELKAISAESQQMREMASKDDDRAALAQVALASSAREEMLQNAENALSVARDAEEKVAKTSEAWDMVLEADGIARDAAEQANAARTEEATLEARQATEKARHDFEEAREALVLLESGKPSINFSDEKKYIEKRIESLDSAIRTANYLLANDREGATNANNAYNAADKEAVALAKNLPESESEKVVKAYESQLENSQKKYDDNRAAATTADSAIRAYLDGR